MAASYVSASDSETYIDQDVPPSIGTDLSEKLPKEIEKWKEADWNLVRRWRRVLLVVAIIKMILAAVILAITVYIKQGKTSIVIGIAPVINGIVWFSLGSSIGLLVLEVTFMWLLCTHHYFADRRLSDSSPLVQQSKAALWVYATAQNILLALCAGVFLVSIIGEYGLYSEQSMQRYFKIWYGTATSESTGKFAWAIHQRLPCCGFNGYADWIRNETVSFKTDDKVFKLELKQNCKRSNSKTTCCVPQSCCKVPSEQNCAICITDTEVPNMDKIHTPGCYQAFKKFVFFWMITVGVLMVCESAACIFSLVALWFSNRNLRLLTAIKLLEEKVKKNPKSVEIYGKPPNPWNVSTPSPPTMPIPVTPASSTTPVTPVTPAISATPHTPTPRAETGMEEAQPVKATSPKTHMENGKGSDASRDSESKDIDKPNSAETKVTKTESKDDII